MAIDDKLAKLIDNLSRESQISLPEEGLRAAVNAAIAVIPYAGLPIAGLLAGRANRRIQGRAIEMFSAIKERLEKLDENEITKDFFEGEEFQSLFALALEQLQTTHDKAKLRMLAIGLANSAALEFSSETRKELFLRILRDLSPEHVSILTEILPAKRYRSLPSDTWPTLDAPQGEKLAILQRLVANGLVEEFLGSAKASSGLRFGGQLTAAEAERAVKRALSSVPSRHFRISKFGLDFLKYFEKSG